VDKVLNMKLPEKLYQDLKTLAERKNISQAALVRLILSEYMDKANKEQ